MSDKKKLMDTLIHEGYLKTPSIIKAFQKVDRKDFTPATVSILAYENHPLPIGHKQTISQPLTVAFMLELLEPQQGEKILEIGAGSGWQTTLLAEIIGVQGKIFSIERISELKKMAENNITKYNFIEKEVVTVIHGNGTKGYKKEAPYDKIIAAASATQIPMHWKNQLKIGGRIVTPINQSIITLDKIGQDTFRKMQYFGFNFVPLVA